eukprot:TRINITY_DN5166_c2_g1_i1.p1 TRINITY_DN5166_c2_g1~~TRINITY_DN5166_c2_g1_i1.p1  ORF type:complete len:311 (+),score=64.98 TRINITY_DN5166_c2_g1_i1:256-1188(+)
MLDDCKEQGRDPDDVVIPTIGSIYSSAYAHESPQQQPHQQQQQQSIRSLPQVYDVSSSSTSSLSSAFTSAASSSSSSSTKMTESTGPQSPPPETSKASRIKSDAYLERYRPTNLNHNSFRGKLFSRWRRRSSMSPEHDYDKWTPHDEQINDWIHENLLELFDATLHIYSTILQSCTAASCPQMSAGPVYTFLWSPSRRVKPAVVSAPAYMENLFKWTKELLDDDKIFPLDGDYGKEFIPTTSKIFTRLFRVYAHIYHSHFQTIIELGERKNLNTLFKQFYLFVHKHKLVDDKDMAPLKDLIDNLPSLKTN